MFVSYAELGSALPFNGGAYVYLQHVYGPLVGYLFSSTTVFILKPAPVAIVSLVFGDYVNQLLFFWLAPGELAALLAQKISALICVWTIICIQAMSPQWLTTINTFFTVLKLSAVGSIAVIGIATLGSPFILSYLLKFQAAGNGEPTLGDNWFNKTSDSIGDLALALFSGLWTYNGKQYILHAKYTESRLGQCIALL